MRNNCGFTLMEVIITISILAILGTISFITFSSYVVESRDTKRIVDIESIASALDVSFKRNGSIYPRPISAVILSYTGSDSKSRPFSYLGYVKDGLVTDFNSIPIDPSTSDYYAYGVTTDRKYYELGATLEDASDQGQTSYFVNHAYADGNDDYAYLLGNYRYDPSIGHYLRHLIVLNTLPTGEKKLPRISISLGTLPDTGTGIVTASGVTVLIPNGPDVPYPIKSKGLVSGSNDNGDDDFYIESNNNINIKCINCN